MDGPRFDRLARSLAARGSRRGFLAGAGVIAAAVFGGLRGPAGAQVSQVQCGNVTCKTNPGGCKPGCVCCLYTNSVGQVTNSRCRPPGTCSPGTVACPPERPYADPVRGCVQCLDANQCPAPAGACVAAVCTNGVCGVGTAPDGTPCAAADWCGTGYVCQAGSCTVSVPSCPSAIDGCHLELESCDPVNQICTWRQTCEDCFYNGEQPPPSSPGDLLFCCQPESLCRSLTNSPAEDECCYYDQDCVNGSCCHKDQHCEGQCCPTVCCGGTCCADGEECFYDDASATTVSCQSVPRACGSDEECFGDERCANYGPTGKSCCPDNRAFTHPTSGNVNCCGYGEFSKYEGKSSGLCCPFPSLCNTYRSVQTRL